MSTVAADTRGALRRRSDDLYVHARDYGVLVALIVLCVVFTLTTEAFLTTSNIRNLVEQMAEPALIACGMTVVIIAGEFDLSLGAIFGFGGVIAAVVANSAGVAAAILAALALGCLLGIINGLIVSRGRVESFLVTLATQFAFLGIAIYVTGGENIWSVDDPEVFAEIAQGTLLGIEYPAWIALATLVIVGFCLSRTPWGKQVFAIGGNLNAARVAGVRIHVVRVSVFALAAALAALAGTLAAADSSIAQAGGGIGLEFSAITAVIVGGTSIAGGKGSVWRTLIGLMLLTVIANGFTLLYIDPTYNLLVQGSIILAAVVIDARLKRRGA